MRRPLEGLSIGLCAVAFALEAIALVLCAMSLASGGSKKISVVAIVPTFAGLFSLAGAFYLYTWSQM